MTHLVVKKFRSLLIKRVHREYFEVYQLIPEKIVMNIVNDTKAKDERLDTLLQTYLGFLERNCQKVFLRNV